MLSYETYFIYISIIDVTNSFPNPGEAHKRKIKVYNKDTYSVLNVINYNKLLTMTMEEAYTDEISKPLSTYIN